MAKLLSSYLFYFAYTPGEPLNDVLAPGHESQGDDDCSRHGEPTQYHAAHGLQECGQEGAIQALVHEHRHSGDKHNVNSMST